MTPGEELAGLTANGRALQRARPAAPVNLADVPSLPTVLDGHKTAEILGCSYWLLLELVKRGEAPVEPLRLGRRLVWPTARVLEALGIPVRDEGAVSSGASVI